MMNLNCFLVLFFFLGSMVFGFSQEPITRDAKQVDKINFFELTSSKATMSSSEIEKKYRFYKNDSSQSITDFIAHHKPLMGLSHDDALRLIKIDEGKNGYIHYRYKQYHKGVPVYGKTYLLHCKEGRVLSGNGSLAPRINCPTNPTLNSKAAHASALKAHKSTHNGPTHQMHSKGCSHCQSKNKTKDTASNDCTKSSDKSELIILEVNAKYYLSYKVDMPSNVPEEAMTYYIDAHTGAVLDKESLIVHYTVPGTGQSRYYGQQNMNVDSLAKDDYVLFDASRGNDGISVIGIEDDEDIMFRSTTRDFSFEDSEIGQTAIDAYYCTISFHDMLKNEFDWLGLDNENLSFNIGVNARDRTDYVNAYWNGSMAWIGNGDCNRGPLSTLEVVGHEFMHGVVDYTSELAYRSESGAINESMADVMGKMLEHYYDPQNFKWEIGHSFILNEYSESFRNMAEPLLSDNPAYYGGDNWRYNGGVHTNSAIGNLWFYYLSEGGVDINEGGEPFSVSPLGIETAGKFIFHINRHYLTEDSQYIDYYEASLLAADEYFSSPSSVIEDIQEAWKAVGLPGMQAEADYFDLRVFSVDAEDACGMGTYVPLAFGIVNEGKIDYSSGGDQVEIDISNGSNNGSEILDIESDIAIGDTLLFAIDSLLVTENDDLVLIRYELLFEDDYNSNNSDLDLVSVNLYEENDLELDVEILEQKCFTSEKLLEIEIRNNSCNDISEGTAFEIIFVDMETEELLWTENLVLEDDLRPDRSEDFEVTIEMDAPHTKEVEAILNGNDPNTEDNVVALTFMGQAILRESYHNEFNGDQDVSENIFVQINDDELPIYEWESNSYFATTGRSRSPSSPLCVDSIRDFEKEVGSFSGGVSATILGCAELSTNVVGLAFDYVQFRNQNYGFATDQSSALKVSWGEGDEANFEIYSGQEEGILESHLIELPDQYAGPIEFRFVNHSGNFSSSSLLDYDLALFDNLRFDLRVGTEEPKGKAKLGLYPNPATEELYIISTSPVHEAQFFSTSGQQVKHLKGNGLSRIDISDLEQGCYFMHLLDAQGEVYREKFVKM